MKTKKDICQSCALPIIREYDKGTEKDGSHSDLYCRRCFSWGDFTESRMTAEEMHEIVRARMIGLKFPRFLAKLSANGVYDLKRWAVVKV
jgi:hypothetical protein